MNPKPLAKLLMGLIAIQLFATMSWAGDTVMTTSDNAPTYGNGLEVVIDNTKTVTLTTNCTNGTVSVTYTPSSGVTMAAGYPQGDGTATETAKFSFDSTTIGVVNTIQINVTHNTSGGNSCLPGGKSNTFTICIPKIAITLNSIAPNTYCSSDFVNNIIITGCDDFAQIQFQQLLNSVRTFTSHLGSVTPYPTGDTIANTGGSFAPDHAACDWHIVQPGSSTTINWQFSGGNTATVTDDHSTPSLTTGSVTISSVNYDYGYLMNHPVSFKDLVRRTDGHGALGEFDWGFTWDNSNADWAARTTFPLLSDFSSATSYSSATCGGIHPGLNTGEFQNSGSISFLPTTHTP